LVPKSDVKRQPWLGAAIAAVLLGLSLSRYGPELWLTDVALEFTPFLFVSSVLVAIYSTLRKQRTTAIVSILAAVAYGLSIYGAHESGLPGRPVGDRTLTITQANLLKLKDTSEAALKLIAAEKPDILVMYEFTSKHEGVLATFSHVSRRPYRDGMDMVIASRFPVERFERGWRVTVDGTVLTIYSIHPHIPDTPAKWAERNRVLRATADHTRAQGPMILVGDFNTTPYSRSFQYIERTSGLRNSSRGRGYFPSWPSPGLLPLDHLFVSEDIAVIDKRVSMGIGSDHRPITTVIRL